MSIMINDSSAHGHADLAPLEALKLEAARAAEHADRGGAQDCPGAGR
jgi:hypothetical protein